MISKEILVYAVLNIHRTKIKSKEKKERRENNKKKSSLGTFPIWNSVKFKQKNDAMWFLNKENDVMPILSKEDGTTYLILSCWIPINFPVLYDTDKK